MSDAPDMSDREGLAAEYVLGTLPLAERLQAERLIASDVDFAALVEAWQTRLAPLNEGYAELAPPPGLQARIEARLFPVAQKPARRWWPFLGAFAAAAAALVIAIYIPSPRSEPEITATLVGENQPLVIAAAWDADAREVTFTRTGGPEAEAGKDYELWVIPAGQNPISLGVLPADGASVPLDKLEPGMTLAVTLEAAGGSNTGAPQGPILAAAVIEG